jgi:hypothetical protein
MKYFISITIALCFSMALSAQETIDLLTFSGRYGFPSSYDSIYDGKAKEVGFMAGLVAPAKISEKSIWYTSVNYFYFHVSDNEEMPKDIVNPINVHGIILRTGLVQKFSEGRALQIFFSPRLMSDFHNIDGTHFQYGGMVLYEKLFSDKLKMGFGAMYNQEFFGPYLVPLINLNWHINDSWSITGLIPVYAKIKYKISDRLNVGLSHFGLTTTYRLGEVDYEGDYLERKSIDETLFARYRLAGNIYIEGRLGYAIGRSYAQYEADQKVDFSLPLISIGDDRVQKNVSFHDGLIASLRFVYSIPIP